MSELQYNESKHYQFIMEFHMFTVFGSICWSRFCPSAQHDSGIGRMECIFDSTCAGPSCRNRQMDLKADLAHAKGPPLAIAPISPGLSELRKGQTGSK